MKIQEQSDKARQFGKKYAKQFCKAFPIPKTSKDYGLGRICVGMSGVLEREEYTEAYITKAIKAARRFNQYHSLQFKVFEFETHVEIARIA